MQCAEPVVSISVVSHGQGGMVAELLADLVAVAQSMRIEVLLTLNIPEALPVAVEQFPYRITVIENASPKGFGANHNAAFKVATAQWFCVMNPDIRLRGNPFPALLVCLDEPGIAVAAPLVVGVDGEIEDSARRFPSPLKIACKALGRCRGGDYAVGAKSVRPDWVGGMFMLFPACTYQSVGGFDERYFLYYEDVDLCARLRLLGHEIVLCSDATVVHHARRASHRNLRYLRWHLGSMTRFFLSPAYRQVLYRRWAGRTLTAGPVEQ